MSKYYRYLVCFVMAITTVGCAGSDQSEPFFFATLFSGEEQYENFNRVSELIPTSSLNASSRPFEFIEGEPIELPTSFSYQDREVATDDFLAATDTSAILVLKDGEIVNETYRLTGGRKVNWLSMSVAKS